MQIRLQIICAAVLLFILAGVVLAIRKKRLEIRYSLSWILVIAVLLAIDCFPQSIEYLADLLGIQLPSNMLFLVGFAFFMIIVFGLTTAVSRLSIKNKTLVQEIAILKKRVEDLEKETEN